MKKHAKIAKIKHESGRVVVIKKSSSASQQQAFLSENRLRKHKKSLAEMIFDGTYIIITVAMLIGLYSFLINSIHGHPSYWKWGWRWVRFPWFGNSSQRGTKRARLKSILRKPSKERVMETIEEYILHEAFSFLTADEMLTISCLSRRFRDMTQQKKVWRDLTKIYFPVTPSLSDENALSSLVNKRAFFAYLKQYPLILAKSRINRFVIEGKVYELPAQFMSGKSLCVAHLVLHLSIDSDITDITLSRYPFLTQLVVSSELEHPGGEAILMEHAGSDASREFSLANHSSLAITLAESFMIWPASGLFDPTKRKRMWTRRSFA